MPTFYVAVYLCYALALAEVVDHREVWRALLSMAEECFEFHDELSVGI